MIVHRIPAFDDNYLWIIEDSGNPKQVAVVDPGDAQPIIDWLIANDRDLSTVLLTHHHGDHVGGVAKLREWVKDRQHTLVVIGPEGDAPKIHFEYQQLRDQEQIQVLGFNATVLHVPGHTLGHIAYWFEGNEVAFCGDTLFAMGCGRLFEGTAEQMWSSLAKLASLPDNTLMHCAHEYTASNCKFALSEEPTNQHVVQRAAEVAKARAAGLPTVPFTIGHDKLSNPFLRAKKQDFAALRQRKDVFR
jgi:hydroxyacylglutathione hydrolase